MTSRKNSWVLLNDDDIIYEGNVLDFVSYVFNYYYSQIYLMDTIQFQCNLVEFKKDS